jgi:hypothetical protein
MVALIRALWELVSSRDRKAEWRFVDERIIKGDSNSGAWWPQETLSEVSDKMILGLSVEAIAARRLHNPFRTTC